METNKPQFLNIMGTGRNGSTLLMRLLDGSPNLWVYPIEFNYLRKFGKRKKKHLLFNKIRNRVFGANYDDFTLFQFITRQTNELEETYLNRLKEPYEANGGARDYFFKQKQKGQKHKLYNLLEAKTIPRGRPTWPKPPMMVISLFNCINDLLSVLLNLDKK